MLLPSATPSHPVKFADVNSPSHGLIKDEPTNNPPFIAPYPALPKEEFEGLKVPHSNQVLQAPILAPINTPPIIINGITFLVYPLLYFGMNYILIFMF